MAWKGNRSRPILKSVTFSEEEWRWIRDAMRVENRMRRSAGLRQVGWMAFARNRIRTAHAVNIIVPPDLRGLAAQVARIGNNINQIARSVNAGIARPEDAKRGLYLLDQVYELMYQVAKK